MAIDSAFAAALSVVSDARNNINKIRSEEDAKLQIITRMLTEVLGWSHSDISSEGSNENGFSDYVISDGGQSAFVIEAKKIGEIDLDTSTTRKSTYKISGPVLRRAIIGIKQAASYCHPLGIQLAVLTDGVKWINFLPWVRQASYLEKQAIVFPSFDALIDDFSTFYELLSKEHIRKHTYTVIFDAIHESRLVLDRTLTAAIAPGDNFIIQKTALAFDLENVFATFFSGLIGDDDPDMLINCFVETQESRVADFSLEKITKNVLGNINPQEREIEDSLITIVQNTVAGELGQTIFIVGPSGAGKSTFLTRFFAKTLAPNIREQCVVISIDALDASGNQDVALPWMTERAIDAIHKQTFASGYPEWNDLQALYQGEYVKRSEGVDAPLYRRSKDEFKEKFAGFVEQLVEKDREGYLNRLLRDVVRNRKKLPIFVIDNTDEFSIAYKTTIFQYFQALRRSTEHCLLIFPATDRSAWTFSKTDIFNIYSSRSFFLPTPSPREVFRKRIEYLKTKLHPPAGDARQAEYLVGRGIRVTIKDLAAFASVVESIFVDQDYAAKRVGEIANYNIRKTLGLSRRIVTSSVLRVDDLIKAYITGTPVTMTPEVFTNALVRGDYQFFRPGDESLLFPIFQVDATVRQSPLVHARLLLLLRAHHEAAADDSARYLLVESIFSYFGAMAIPEISVQRSLETLLLSGLIEPYDLSKKDYSDDQRVAITYSGLAHLDFALHNPVFFDQMALTTRIADGECAAHIRGAYYSGAYYSNKSNEARLEQVRKIFCQYLIDEDARLSVCPVTPEFRLQAQLSDELADRWTTGKLSARDMLEVPSLAAVNTAALVQEFKPGKGYGFVEVPEISETAFVHAATVTRYGFDELFDGDELQCDIQRTDKGLAVSRIYGVKRPPSQVYRGRIVKLFPDRHYEFIHITDLRTDAIFYYDKFSLEDQRTLSEGQYLSVEIKTDRRGRSQVRRIVT